MIGTPSASGSQLPQSLSEPPNRVDPDADILYGLANGQQDALNQLMIRHLAPMKATAFYMLGDEMMAEDIAQEVFLRAWKQAPNWQAGKAKFSTWLHRVAKNLCYDHLRKKTEIYADAVPEMADERPEALQTLNSQQHHDVQKTRIEEALNTLPKRQHMAIILCHYHNMSQIDAAAIMEIGVRAYESLLARARNNLRNQLQQHKTELLDE